MMILIKLCSSKFIKLIKFLTCLGFWQHPCRWRREWKPLRLGIGKSDEPLQFQLTKHQLSPIQWSNLNFCFYPIEHPINPLTNTFLGRFADVFFTEFRRSVRNWTTNWMMQSMTRRPWRDRRDMDGISYNFMCHNGIMMDNGNGLYQSKLKWFELFQMTVHLGRLIPRKKNASWGNSRAGPGCLQNCVV